MKGGRWPASERKGVLGCRGMGQGGGWRHPCPDSSFGCGWTSASHLEKAATISTWVTDICKGGFLGVAGSRMDSGPGGGPQAILHRCSETSFFTLGGAMPRAPLCLSLEAQRCPPAASSHTSS